MSIHGYCKKTWRVLLVSLMLVFSLNIVAAAADSDDYQSQVIWDLAQISEYLSDIYISLETYLPLIQSSLNDISTTLDSYFDMLAVMQSSLESIETDASSIVSKLTTIASNLTYNNKSVAYYANVTNNNLLSRTTKILDFQEAASEDLASVITKLTSVNTDLDSVIESLSALNDNLFTVWTEVISVNTNLGTVIDNQDTFYPYFASIDSELDLATDLLIEIYNNISSLISSQKVANTTLSNIEALLSYNEKSAAHLIGMMNNNMIYNFNDLFVYQEAAAADLATMIDKLTTANSSLSTIATEITSADSRLGTVVTKITSVDTNIASALFYDGTSIAVLLREMGINMGLQHTLLQNDLGEANTHLSNLHSDLLIWLMNDQVGLISKLNALVEKQETANTSLSNIESLLSYNEKSAAHLIGLMNNNMIYRFNDLFVYQEAAAADLATVIDKLTTANTSLSTIAMEITSADDRLSTVVTKVTAMDTNLSSVVTKITSVDSRLNTANTNLTTMISNQSELLDLLQEDGVFTTDISGVLTDLDSVLSNQSTLVTSLVGLSTNLSSVVTKITSVDSRLNTANTNLTTMISNQSELLDLLQEDGVFTSDLSGVLTNQQKLIDLLEELNDTAVENIQNITIDVTNEAYEIFYITDGNGNEQNLGDFSGDILTISGRLLNFFFKVAFDDAMDSVDSALDDMTEFYLDDSVVVGGSSLWE